MFELKIEIETGLFVVKLGNQYYIMNDSNDGENIYLSFLMETGEGILLDMNIDLHWHWDNHVSLTTGERYGGLMSVTDKVNYFSAHEVEMVNTPTMFFGVRLHSVKADSFVNPTTHCVVCGETKIVTNLPSLTGEIYLKCPLWHC